MRRREFDGQRDAIEVSADRANAREFAGTRREICVRRLGSGDEQLDRAAVQNVLRVILPGSRHLQRRQPIDLLALGPEGFPTRRDDRGVRAVRQKCFGQCSGCLDEVFAIVQYQQQLFVPDRTRNGVGCHVAKPGGHSKRAGNRRSHQGGLGQ